MGHIEYLGGAMRIHCVLLVLCAVLGFQEISAQPVFRRGDVDSTGNHNLNDPIYLLNFLFLGGPILECDDAADANDDGVLDVADPISILQALFLGGSSVPEPGFDCGSDPTADSLGCDSYCTCDQLRPGGDGSFEPPVHILAGRAVESVAVGDLNADGFQDIVFRSSSVPRIGVLLGAGGGAFESVVDFGARDSVNRRPVRLVDIDGDGALDVMLPSSSVRVAFGDGEGGFSRSRIYPFGFSWQLATYGDVNGDDIIDLVFVVQSDVLIVLGLGGGEFAAPVSYEAPLVRRAPGALGDVNGDGAVDIVVAGSPVVVLLSDGAGGFDVVPIPRTETRRVDLTDLDNDGISDLIVSPWRPASHVSVFHGSRHGVLRSNSASYLLGCYPRTIAAADVDGDGFVDLVGATTSPDDVAVLRGVGDGSFLPLRTYATGDSVLDLAVVDLNDDARLDVITAGEDGIVVLLGRVKTSE